MDSLGDNTKKILKTNKFLSQKSTTRNECVLSTKGERDYMEDNRSIYHRDNISIYTIYDGHGGYKTSQRATTELSDIIYDNLINVLPTDDEEEIEIQIKKSFYDFDQSLLENMDDHYEDGTTVTMVIYIKDAKSPRIYFVNLGDSRTMMIQITDMVEMIFSTFDHKPVYPSEINRIIESGGTVAYGRVNGNIGVSRSLGDLTYKIKDDVYEPVYSPVSSEPDVFSIEATPGILILATDGLWDVITNGEVVTIVDNYTKGKNTNITKACKDLIKLALQRESGDNITVMAIVIK